MNEIMDQSIEETDRSKLQTIGDLIRQSREQSHLTIKDLSKATKIGITMLELLEADELNQLPNRAYVSGYVKSCCKELGLNQKLALETLDQTYLAHGAIIPPKKYYEAKEPAKKKAPNQEEQKVNFRFKLSTKSISIAVLLLFILLAYNYYHNNSPKVEQVNIVEDASQQVHPKTISETTPLIEEHETTSPDKKTEQGTMTSSEPKVVAPAPAPVVEKKTVKPEEEKGKKSKYETVSAVTLRTVPSGLFSIKDTSAEQLALVPQNFQQAVVTGKENLYIIAKTDSSWLTYKKDSEEIKALKLKKGEALFLTGDEFRLFFGNINSTLIFYNNQLIDAPSSTGVKSLIFPATSNKKFKLPLFVYLKDGRIITSEQYEAN